MNRISSLRISVPKESDGEILRQMLVDKVLSSPKKLVYLHAGAGYGKTTLLSQIAHANPHTIWLTLEADNEIITFITTLSEAVRRVFPEFRFVASEFILFEGKDRFISMLASAFTASIENLGANLLIIMDDLHPITELKIREFITALIRYMPDGVRILLSSRESSWPELESYRLRGYILELNQKDFAFTPDEVVRILGFHDDSILEISEGWPLAIRSFKLLLENGVSISHIPSLGSRNLYSYLFHECITRLPEDMVSFLSASACFETLDADMLNGILQIDHASLILESLITRSMFTQKTEDGYYRYHALFRECLLNTLDEKVKRDLQERAARYYYQKYNFSRAADNAILCGNTDLLANIIASGYRSFIRTGQFAELRRWFQEVDEAKLLQTKTLLVAKGAFLSCIGNFTEAQACLDLAIPQLSEDDYELFVEATVHKARVLRNNVSIEVSNKLLDELIERLSNPSSELSYTIFIEKIYNLCWNSQINQAFALASKMIGVCSKAGNLKVRAWYERYLGSVYFFSGKMKECVECYEKTLRLPDEDRHFLSMHSVDIHAAKAYQMLGQRHKAVTIIADELQSLKEAGRYEELWAGYLLAAEIHYQNAFADKINGLDASFEESMAYFNLAHEYAPLCRHTEFQAQWARMQHLTSSLIFSDGPKDRIINEIMSQIDQGTVYLKSIVLGRLFSYFCSIPDIPNAVQCARRCIEIGEKENIMLIPTAAYGVLARAAFETKDHNKMTAYIGKYLRLCAENGIYDYLRIKRIYGPILEFALEHGIQKDFVHYIMELFGYQTRKASVLTFGGLWVTALNGKKEPVKMRTKKERELLVFLLNSGSVGATKDQISHALWSESESDNIKKLIGVNLAHIKKDLSVCGIHTPIINENRFYRINRDEMECDMDLMESAIKQFKRNNSLEAANSILSLYKGEFLEGYEALWITTKRIYYSDAFEKAQNYIKEATAKP